MDSPVLHPPLLFISDVHLGAFSAEENTRIESELIQLINYCQRNSIRLAILGDLFDYWMEYPNYVPNLGKRLLNRFESFNQVYPTLYITGNHDNWTRDHLIDYGFVLEHEQRTFSNNGQTFMALHGDGLSDPGYNLARPLMHRFLRNQHFLKLYQTIFPPRLGLLLMKYFSRTTRWLDSSSDPDKLNTWAKQQLENSETNFIISGHDHVPRLKQFPFGTYINLGTFYRHKTMAYYNKEEISLVCWEASTQTLRQFETSINE